VQLEFFPDDATAYAFVTFKTNGEISYKKFPGGTVSDRPGEWYTTPTVDIGDDYEIRLDVDSGDNPTGAALATWIPLTSDVSWEMNSFQSGVGTNYKEAVTTVQIRRASDSVVVQSQTINWLCDAEVA
jgi:hypothetical protein